MSTISGPEGRVEAPLNLIGGDGWMGSLGWRDIDIDEEVGASMKGVGGEVVGGAKCNK